MFYSICNGIGDKWQTRWNFNRKMCAVYRFLKRSDLDFHLRLLFLLKFTACSYVIVDFHPLNWWFNCVCEWVIHAKWLNKKTVFIQISDFPLRIHFHADFFQINLRLVMRKSRQFSHSPVNTTYLHLFSIFPIEDIMLTRRLRANNSMDIYLAKMPIRYVSIRWNVQFSMNINSNVKLHE